MLQRKIAVFVAGLLLGTAALAAPPSESSIDELLQTTQAQAMLETLFANLETQLEGATQEMMGDMPMDEATQQKLQEMQKKSAQILREETGWDKMRTVYIQIYRESLTQEELDGMLAFYKTPAGQAMLKKMPVIIQKSMQITQEQIMPRVMTRLQALQKEYIADILQNQAKKPACEKRSSKNGCK